MGVADLQIGGGANLFTHEDFGDANIYDADQPEFCGLRDYPILKSPNTATVSVVQYGDVAGGDPHLLGFADLRSPRGRQLRSPHPRSLRS